MYIHVSRKDNRSFYLRTFDWNELRHVSIYLASTKHRAIRRASFHFGQFEWHNVIFDCKIITHSFVFMCVSFICYRNI